MSKFGSFTVFFPGVTDKIYIFAVAKQGFLGNFGTGIYHQKVLREIFVRNNATHVVTSTSNIMTSLFDLA